MSFPRIERLRSRCLDRPNTASSSEEMRYLFAKGWADSAEEYITSLRRTRARAAVYRGVTPVIGADELIVGRPNHDAPLSDAQRAFARDTLALIPRKVGQDSHMALDYEKLLRLGTEGLRAEIAGRRAGLDTVSRPADIAKETFYDECVIMLDALDDLARRYALHAEALAEGERDAVRAGELRLIAANLRRVPRYPAESFHQALQSVHFYTFGLEGLYQMGRPDQFLLEYYERDIKHGALTREAAQELIDCFCVLYNEYTARGLAVGLMVGGRYPDGSAVVNDLTTMFIQSIFDVRMAYPGVGLCVTPDTPEALMRLALSALAAGHTHPALFNDEVITRGLMGYGLPFEEAVSYIHSTCVEITPIKRSGVWVASPYHNLIAPLLELMGVGGETEDAGVALAGAWGAGQPTVCAAAHIDELIGMYQAKLHRLIADSVYDQNRQQMERSRWYTHPLVSCLVEDCLERGADIDQGGARYAFIESSFVGMANLVDSLIAIDQLVFREKALSLKAFGDALRANFEGREPLRQRILTSIPKYGNDAPEPDALFKRMSDWIVREMAQYETWHGARFIPSMFCWVMHAQIGKDTPASPDGRLAGFPLGDGSGPAQGREKSGPTASVISSTCWNHEPFIGGIAVNLKFAKGLFTGESLDKLMQLVRVFMERGGFELQLNVVDRAKMLAAQQDPEAYRDLVVRIGGYSDYFTNLSPQMQQEVLLRTEHQL